MTCSRLPLPGFPHDQNGEEGAIPVMNMLTIVWDGIRRRKIRTALSMLGIAIAAAA